MDSSFITDGKLPDGDRSPAANGTPAGLFGPIPGRDWTGAALRLLARFSTAAAASLAHACLTRRHPVFHPETSQAPWSSARVRWVDSGQAKLRVHEWGAGPVVLLVHGWGASSAAWEAMVLPLVHAGHRVVAFDAPRHGGSTGASCDFDDFAAAIAAVARNTGPLHCAIGHSLGAAMVLYASRDWGVAPDKMVLVNAFDHCSWFVDAFGRHLGLPGDVVHGLREIFVRRSSGRFDWGRMSLADMLRQGDRPVLLLRDRNDAEVPTTHCAGLASASSRVELRKFAGAGHHGALRSEHAAMHILRFLGQ